MFNSHPDLPIIKSLQDQSLFFNRLPPEIRNKIYTYVFIRDTSVYTRWQTGEMWQVEWPQLDSEYMYTKVRSEFNKLEEDLVFDADALGAIDGVDLCGCGCGDVSWTAANLIQEGGRRVRVHIVFCTRAEQYAYDPSWDKYHEVKLIPGTAPESSVIAERAGVRYEPDEEYWEGMRRKNGNLGTWCRGLWKRAMAFENESYSRLTGQGGQAVDLV
ncbi:hypothetical protein N0V91_007797 [Didymella pomorum]|uniref:Uncharacterized protein n=1 Tax=Didymella pomorum TaxID=749634 RepID=A0A9W8ZAR7_9PLEO|nr:hypothetical protein N0V91_007797 [Didymella pomorum]